MACVICVIFAARTGAGRTGTGAGAGIGNDLHWQGAQQIKFSTLGIIESHHFSCTNGTRVRINTTHDCTRCCCVHCTATICTLFPVISNGTIDVGPHFSLGGTSATICPTKTRTAQTTRAFGVPFPTVLTLKSHKGGTVWQLNCSIQMKTGSLAFGRGRKS